MVPSNKILLDLSFVILSDGHNDLLASIVPQIRMAAETLNVNFEILVVEENPDDKTQQVCQEQDTHLVKPENLGYGAALLKGFEQANGQFVLVVETDHSYPVNYIKALWDARHSAEVVIASRYIPGGKARMPWLRLVLSKMVNRVFSRGLDLQIKDMSSGYRLYNAVVIQNLSLKSQGYNILQEILVRILMEGYFIREIPFRYHSIYRKATTKRILQFGLNYLKTFSYLWKLRNSIESADYDARAHDSWVPPQRYWQRRRFKFITKMVYQRGAVLDVGCGSSLIMDALPPGSVVLDYLGRKLRFSRRYGHPPVQGSIHNLPVKTESFPCVICSQVIEHVPRENVLDELDRVLEPGGYMILGTPDYANWQWIVIEWLYKVLLPQAYADEHITHYTYEDLIDEMVTKRGYILEESHYILKGELILGLRKAV